MRISVLSAALAVVTSAPAASGAAGRSLEERVAHLELLVGRLTAQLERLERRLDRIAPPKEPAPAPAEARRAEPRRPTPRDRAGRTEFLKPRLLSRKFEQKLMQSYLWFDIEWTATGLTKPAQAPEGVLEFADPAAREEHR